MKCAQIVPVLLRTTRRGMTLVELLAALGLCTVVLLGLLGLGRTLRALEASVTDHAQWFASAHAAVQCVHDELATGARPDSDDPVRGARVRSTEHGIAIGRTTLASGDAQSEGGVSSIEYMLDTERRELHRIELIEGRLIGREVLLGGVASFEAASAADGIRLLITSTSGHRYVRTIGLREAHVAALYRGKSGGAGR